MTEQTALGTVEVLRRYPVKSLLGEDLRDGEVTARGLAGDRVLGLVHRETGKIASAKNPRLWRRLLKLRAAFRGPGVRITFPDGAVLDPADPDIGAALSAFLGQPVTLATTPPPDATFDRAVPEEVLAGRHRRDGPRRDGPAWRCGPRGYFVDFAPLHLITTSTLDRIAALSPRGAVELERYRPNIVIRTETPGFAENDWAGRDLRIGRDLVIRVIARTPRCAIPTLEHGDLPRDTDALRVPAAHNRISAMGDFAPQPCAGVYARVISPGRVGLGDVAQAGLSMAGLSTPGDGDAGSGGGAGPGPAAARPATAVPLRTVLREWGRIGVIGFGGPPAHIRRCGSCASSAGAGWTQPSSRTRSPSAT